MPPYDPKANRPKLVPVEDDAAPVDALLGPDVDADPPASEAAPARPHLSVVGAEPAAAPRPAPEPVVAQPARRPDLKVVVAVVVVAAAIVGVVVARRR